MNAQRLLDEAPDAVYWIRRDGSLAYVNRSAWQLLGYTREDLLALTLFDIDVDLDRKWWDEHWNEMEDAESATIERRHRHNNGELIPVEVNIRHLTRDGEHLHFSFVRDLRERRQLEAEQQAQQRAFERLRKAVSSAPIPMMLFHNDGRVEQVNDTWCELTGYRPEQLDSIETWTRLAYGSTAGQVREVIAQLADAKGRVDEGDFVITCADGSHRVWRFFSNPLDQTVEGDRLIISAAIDVTLERRQQDWQRLYETIFEQSAEGITITDSQRRIVHVNLAFTRVTGYEEEEVRGKNPSILSSGRQDAAFYRRMWQQIDQTDHWQGEIWNRRKNGEIYPEWLSISAIRDERGELTHYAAVFTDLTELEEFRERLKQAQQFDSLTGLMNRMGLGVVMEEFMTESSSRARGCTLLMMGLDRFQLINESFDHEFGDQLLHIVASRLENFAEPDMDIARIGGDRFALLVRGDTRMNHIETMLSRLYLTLARPIRIAGQPPVTLQFSTGIARFPADAGNAPDLLRVAEAAMFNAKKLRPGHHAWFDQKQAERAQQRLMLEIELRQALESNQLEVHLQPIVAVSNNRIVGAEALARWPHPERGMIPPDAFIPVAEECGLIGELTMKLLARAAGAMAGMERSPAPKLWLAFNISASQLGEKDFAGQICEILEKAGLPTTRFELELTESMLMQQAGSPSPVLTELEQHGISISIDDFGTGYSSLAYLHEINAKTLKIDRRFVADIEADGAGTRIASTIIAMAHGLGMEVIAEGVETDGQLEVLREMGCEYYQGYLFSPALPIDEFNALVEGQYA